MPNVGPLELFILFAIVLLLFGAKRLPELGAGVGRGLHDFAKGLKGEDDKPGRVEAAAAPIAAPVAPVEAAPVAEAPRAGVDV